MIDEDNWVKREATEAPPHIQCSRLLLSRWCMAALTCGCVGAPPLIFRGSKWCWGREGGSWRHRCRNFAKLIASLFLAHFHFHRVCGPFLFQRRLLSSSFFSSSTCFLVEILLSVMSTLSRSVLFSLVVVVWLPPLFTCWKAVACFLARPFPHSHRRPLAARKEDGGEGEGGSCSLHKKDQDNKKQNQNYFQTRGTWAVSTAHWAVG